MSFETIKDIVNFNPSRPLSKGKEAPFIDMASLPVNGRDINEVSNKVFNGGGAKFKNGDTLFARITPCLENGKTAKVENLPVDCIAHGSTEFIVLSAKSKDDEDFVYYLARSPDFRNYAISRMEGTSGRQRVSWQALAEFNLRLPEKSKRKKIGEILKSLDDKIHLNNQINQTLESIAQALFKSWFVDFDPVRAKIAAKQEGKDSELAAMCIISGKSEDEIQQMPEGDFAELQATAALFPEEFVVSELGEVPKGWEVSTVGEQVQAVGGGTPSTKNADFWDNGIHYWTTPKDLSNLTDKILLNTERKLTDTGLKKISSGLLPKNTVLMSSRAPVGYLALAKIEVAINQGYIAILPNTKYSAEYLIQWCEANMAEIKGRASGTTFLEISKKNFKEINFICSDEKVVTVYTKTAKTLYDEISLKAEENQILINLRDTLLPKLLSGELEVLT
ncbi:restriction endonuclease subunit S [Acinetobacter nosocomialis]|nr:MULTISPECIES: restriction endonuclease subunit S [Acinetobacter]